MTELSGKPEITRFKGLGEISPKEFAQFSGKEMVLAHGHRVEHASRAESGPIFNFYMGKNTPECKDYLMDKLVVPVRTPETLWGEAVLVRADTLCHSSSFGLGCKRPLLTRMSQRSECMRTCIPIRRGKDQFSGLARLGFGSESGNNDQHNCQKDT